jgi:hypothetical protein
MFFVASTAQHRIPPDRVYLDGTKVEVIGTGAIEEADLEGLDDLEIFFVAGHRWALETATPMRLTGDEGISATVPVARASALLAMKLHAIQDRRVVGAPTSGPATPGTSTACSPTSTSPPSPPRYAPRWHPFAGRSWLRPPRS